MKAQVQLNEDGNAAVVILIPETAGETTQAMKLAELASRVCIANHRGYAYMNPGVELFIQRKPSGD